MGFFKDLGDIVLYGDTKKNLEKDAADELVERKQFKEDVLFYVGIGGGLLVLLGVTVYLARS